MDLNCLRNVHIIGLKFDAEILDTYSETGNTSGTGNHVDLSCLTKIVLSHGHNDHTKGLKYLLNQQDCKHITLVSHPSCFEPKYVNGEYIGTPFSEQEIEERVIYKPSKNPVKLSEHLTFLGQIPRNNDFEAKQPIGNRIVDGKKEPDFVIDDTALVYHSEDGIFVITGCSHSGICNIMEYAKQVCHDHRVIGLIGGLHLFDDDEQIRRTIDYLKKNQVKLIYPAHCVSLKAKCDMMAHLPIKEVGVGMKISIPGVLTR